MLPCHALDAGDCREALALIVSAQALAGIRHLWGNDRHGCWGRRDLLLALQSEPVLELRVVSMGGEAAAGDDGTDGRDKETSFHIED